MSEYWLKKLLYTLYALIFVFVIYQSEQTYFRIDLTQSKKYTLSPFIQKQITQLQSPLLIDAFLPLSTHAYYSKIAQHTKDLLLDLQQLNPNLVKLTLIDSAQDYHTQDFEVLKAKAERLGIPTQKLITHQQGLQTSFSVPFGVSFTYLNQSHQMSYLESMSDVEYQISRGLKSLIYQQRKLRIGVAQGFGEPQVINSPLWKQLSIMGDVKSVRLDQQSLIGQIDVLLLLGATRPYTERSRWLIDQFLCHGGGVLVALDHRQQSKVLPKVWIPQPMGLQQLWESYGIKVDWRWVMADRKHMYRAALQRDAQGQLLYEEQALYPQTQAQEHPITRGWEALVLPMSPYVEIPQDAKILFQTYDSAVALKDLRSLQLTDAKEEKKVGSQVVAFSIERIFESSFTQQPPAPDGMIDPPKIDHGYGKARLVWFGSGRRLLSAQPKALSLMLYAIDWLQGEEELLKIRQRQVPLPQLTYTQSERLWIQYVLPWIPTCLLLFIMGIIRVRNTYCVL